MRKLLIIAIIFSSIHGFSQNEEIRNLEAQIVEYKGQIKSLNDSIESRESKIKNLKAEQIKTLASDSSVYSHSNSDKATLKDKPDALANIIGYVPEGSRVMILDYTKGYFKVCTDSACGFMSDLWIVKTEQTTQLAERPSKEELHDNQSNSGSSEIKSSNSSNNNHKSNNRTYYTGPKGGCYYLNANGTKTYVDHTYCK